MLFVDFLIVASSMTGNAPVAINPLAMAENGQLQCYRPDVEKRTCQSIATYKRTGSEKYDNKAVIPVSADATLETQTPVRVKDGAVCGAIRAEDVLVGTLRVGGEVVPPEKAKPFLERILQGFAPLSGKEICTRYEPAGNDFTAKIAVAGSYQPELDVAVKWISPSDGYTVKP